LSDDLVIATRHVYSLQAFIEAAAPERGISVRQEGQGAAESGFDERWCRTFAPDSRDLRSPELEALLGRFQGSNYARVAPVYHVPEAGCRDDARRREIGRA
jgi:GDP-D-mannose dehydratase